MMKLDKKMTLGKKALGLKPSGIRKFFDIVAEMDDVVLSGLVKDIVSRLDEANHSENETKTDLEADRKRITSYSSHGAFHWFIMGRRNAPVACCTF